MSKGGGYRRLREAMQDRVRRACAHPSEWWTDSTAWDDRPVVRCGVCLTELTRGTVLELRQRVREASRSD